MGNWIPDRNRFGLEKPPAWFLKLLWDQDAMLVLLPSRVARKYLLARRRERSRVMATVIGKQHTEVMDLDAALLATHKLVLVDSILVGAGLGTWSPTIIAQLQARDMWAAGGAERYSDQLVNAEAAAEARTRAALLDDIDHRAGDAWRSLQARTGQRNQRGQSTGSVKFVQT